MNDTTTNNETPVAELPRYKCHKEVRALKIVSLEMNTLHFEAPFPPITVPGNWVTKHQPMPGGYYVLYDDNYASFSPAGAFESGYTKMEG